LGSPELTPRDPQADLAQILRERNVVANLNSLEALIADAKSRRARAVDGAAPATPPHLLPPEALLAAHLAPGLAAARSRLNAREQTLLSRNAGLFEEVRGQWAEIEELVSGVEGVVADLQGAGARMEGLERG
jgi:kinetochore protein NNF1